MRHRATAEFWQAYARLPNDICRRADKKFKLLKSNPQHPSLQFKKIGDRHGLEIWSARVTLSYRALAMKREYGYLWFWIGDHTTYQAVVS